jgi:leucyl-tRNA synthetase
MILAHAYKDSRGALIPVDEVKENEDQTFTHIKTGQSLERIVAKMSKSLKNVINPDSVIDQYGADTLRMYLMFMGPLDMARVWDSKAINGNYRFLKRVWSFFAEGGANSKNHVSFESEKSEVKKAINLACKKVTDEIEQLKFNTAISSLMECLNSISKENVSEVTAKTFLKLLNPLAPHMTEELWSIIGCKDCLSIQDWPTYDESYLVESTTSVVVQVNGKKRALLEVEVSITEDSLKKLVEKSLDGTDYKLKGSEKLIIVNKPGTLVPKLVNVIVS